MIAPLHRSYHVPDSYVDKVRECGFIGDWELDDELVIQIAHLLFDYQNNGLTETSFRKYRKQSKPADRNAPLDNLRAWAEQGEKLVAEIRENPYLRESLLPAYEEALKSWPDEIMLPIQDFNNKAVDLYISKTSPPDDAAKDLIETELRMKALVLACKEAVAPDDLPEFKVGRPSEDLKQYVAIEINELLSERIETSEERRACIRELFQVIDLPIDDKTLQNTL